MALEKKGTMMSELDYTKTQLLFFYVVILLAIDSLNPVKIFLHVFPVEPWHVAAAAVCCMTYIFVASMRPLVYFASKVFFHSIMSIFFNDIQVVGLQNVPKYGPVIFTSNHANQFIDGLLIMCTCQRTISYLVAEKSWKRPVVGHLAWAMGAVPVARAQDSAKKGSGSITVEMPAGDSVDKVKVVGKATKFSEEIKVGDKIRLPNSARGITVTGIIDAEKMSLKMEEGVRDILSSQPFPEYVAFDILPHIDLKDTFKNVLEKLSSGGTIGIFPEGGSHDRTDLLPLKVGVSLIAYSQLENGVNVPIIPVGLNYFRTHRFRGKATVEFGAPTFIDPSTLGDFKRGGSDKRRVCSELLGRIEDSMRSVIVSVPDYQTLQVIHAARRLYKQDDAGETAAQRQDMGRRFAEGYKRLLIQTQGDPPEEWLSLQKRLLSYQKELNELGIRDYQVAGLDHEEVDGESVFHWMSILGHICHLLAILALASLPAMLLNFPVGMASRLYSNRRRKVALAASKVKVKGYDVMLSERVLCCIVLVPSLWMLYGLILFFATSLDGPSLAFCVACFPLFSYWSIMATESGMVDVKDLKPYLMRMIPSARKRLAALPAIRRALQVDLRAMIRKIGPSLGTIYYEKEVNWKDITMETKRLSAEAMMGEAKKDD